MRTRIEVNEQGDFYITLPEELIQALMIDEGDVATLVFVDDELILTFE